MHPSTCDLTNKWYEMASRFVSFGMHKAQKEERAGVSHRSTLIFEPARDDTIPQRFPCYLGASVNEYYADLPTACGQPVVLSSGHGTWASASVCVSVPKVQRGWCIRSTRIWSGRNASERK